MTATLICGSLAYDNIMTFEGHFSDHILPDQIHMLNVSFTVPTLRRELGGCAGNIAYNLHLLGGQPVILGTLGKDGGNYLNYLKQLGIPTQNIRTIEEVMTAQAMITTDLANNQITAFHAGAMLYSHLNHIDEAPASTLGIVSPEGQQAMWQHAEEMAASGISFVFDPGQALPLFDGAQLRYLIELASYVAVNDYEAQLLCQQTGWSMAQIAQRVSALIMTRGEHGAFIYTQGELLEIPAVKAFKVLDPTGCGDAFRAGLLYGIDKGWDMATAGRLGSLMGAIKIAHQGPQTHYVTFEEIKLQFQQAFGYSWQ